MAGSFDILRQSGWDAWTWVCIAASGLLPCQFLISRPADRLSRSLVLLGVGGTGLIAALPALHRAAVGLIWTALLMCIVSATFYLNLRDRLGNRRLLTLLGLRCSALALLTPMLFEPVWRLVQKPATRQPIGFLIDASGSMSVADVPNGPTRIQSVWRTLAPRLARLQEHFVPRFYCFSTGCEELKRPQDLAAVSADGKSTDFAAAVNKAAGDGPGALILISDGNDNVSPDVVELLRRSGRTIHTLTVGSSASQPANFINVAVAAVQTPRAAAVGRQSTLTATITNTALADRIVDVNLAEIDQESKAIGPISSRRLVLQNRVGGQNVDLPYTPRSLGVHRLAVWIDPIPGERTVADNRQEVQVLAVQGRVKVLYVEGALRPEYKYLNLMLGHDADIELATLLRLRRDRFAAAGTADGAPFTAMPTSQRDWDQFDVILIGDLDAGILNIAEQSMIRRRVSDGGGLVMIGGEKNFGAGPYQGLPLEEALPVFVGDASIAQDKEEFVPQLTAEGAAHPILAGLTGYFPMPGRSAAMELPPLKGNVVVAGPKAGAQVLLVHAGRMEPDGANQIVLAVQQYGKGRSAAFTADTTNIWYREFRRQGQGSVYNRFWGQLIDWLAGQGVRNREIGAGIDALVNKSVYPFGESVKARVIVRDSHGDTTQFAQVTAKLTGAGLSGPVEAPLAPAAAGGGEYQVILPQPGGGGLKPGDYQLEISASKDAALLGRQTLKFSVIPPQDEMLKIAADPQTMQAIAAATLGYSRPLGELAELMDTLIQTSEPGAAQASEHVVPLENTVRAVMALAGRDWPWPAHTDLPMEGLLVFCLLGGEWVLRRKWQLP